MSVDETLNPNPPQIKDSTDHYAHMSFPEGGNWEGGACPSTHPFRFPTVFFEAIYHTQVTTSPKPIFWPKFP